jgi:hypothetical protein
MYNSLIHILSDKEKIIIDINSIIRIDDLNEGIQFTLDGVYSDSINTHRYYTDEMTWDDITKNFWFRLTEVEKSHFIETKTHTIFRPREYDVNVIINKKHIIMAHTQKNDKTKSVIMLTSGEIAVDMSIDQLCELLAR